MNSYVREHSTADTLSDCNAMLTQIASDVICVNPKIRNGCIAESRVGDGLSGMSGHVRLLMMMSESDYTLQL